MDLPENLVTLAAVLLTAAATLLGVFLGDRGNTARLKMQLEHDHLSITRELRREKSEELYMLNRDWVRLFHSSMFNILHVMKGTFDYNFALDLMIEEGKENPLNFARVHMLVDLYFPPLKPQFIRVCEARNEVSEIVKGHREKHESGDHDGIEFVVPMEKAMREVVKASEDFSMAIATLHNYGDVRS